jgi:integrase
MAVKVRFNRGKWWVHIDHHGQRKARCFGKGTVAQRTAVKLADGGAPFIEREAVPLFTAYSETWITETIAPHRKRRTHDYYTQLLTTHLRPAFGAMRLDEIRPRHARAFIAKKLAGGAARNTVKNMAATLRAILYAAQEDELIPSNPAARVGRFFNLRHDPRAHVVVLEPEHVAQVLAAAGKWYSEWEVLVTLLFFTGMREREVLGVQWPDLDPSRKLLDLRRTVAIRQGALIVNTPKSGRLRIVDVPTGLMAQLQERRSIGEAEAAVAGRAPSPWVFPSATDPDRPLNVSWWWRHVWTPLLNRAQVRPIRVHDARHTYASLMLRRGVPITYVSR